MYESIANNYAHYDTALFYGISSKIKLPEEFNATINFNGLKILEKEIKILSRLYTSLRGLS